jgi:hypothetical protein
MPRDRKNMGNYILVETKLCKALNLLNARRDQLLEESRQVEHMIKRPLAAKMLNAYPEDEAILSMVKDLRVWWIRQFQEAKADNGGVLPDNVYDRIANGFYRDHPGQGRHRQGHQHGGSSHSRPG